jgi:hypothetical protein
MRKSNWLPTRVLAAGLTLFAAVTVTAKDPKPIKDPPGTEIYMAQFRLLFDKWDLDKDGYLDKEELAKAFRGPNAKPYDYVPPPKTTVDKEKDKDKAEGDKKDPEKKDPEKKEVENKDPGKQDSESKDPKKPDYSRFPDYIFLIQLDQDKDDQISREEFMSWARDVSIQYRDQADALRKLQQAQLNLQKHANKTASAEYKKAAAALKHEQDQLNKIAKQMAKYEKQMANLQQQIKVK